MDWKKAEGGGRRRIRKEKEIKEEENVAAVATERVGMSTKGLGISSASGLWGQNRTVKAFEKKEGERQEPRRASD